MTTPRRGAGLAGVGCAVLLAGCGSQTPTTGGDVPASDRPAASPSSGPPTPSASATSAPATPSVRARAGVVVTTGASDFGTMLFDGRRQAIYLFDKETTSRPACYGACAEAWPPVLAKGSPQARGKVRDGLLGTVPRRDGTRQVTYAGHPLYYYAHEGPGQVLCHDIVEYGGTWLVVTPGGQPAP